MCKPWKINGFTISRENGEKFSDHRRRSIATKELGESDPIKENDDVI